MAEGYRFKGEMRTDAPQIVAGKRTCGSEAIEYCKQGNSVAVSGIFICF